MKALASGILCLLVAAAASAGVVVVADEGAALRIDAAKLAGLTEAAIRHVAPRAAAFTVTIAIDAPQVTLTWARSRGAQGTWETVSGTYTITDPSGVVRESAPIVLPISHSSTLESRLLTMRLTAEAIAARVRAVSGN
jgi:hypothetical protein